jgi:hypothetical protein
LKRTGRDATNDALEVGLDLSNNTLNIRNDSQDTGEVSAAQRRAGQAHHRGEDLSSDGLDLRGDGGEDALNSWDGLSRDAIDDACRKSAVVSDV